MLAESRLVDITKDRIGRFWFKPHLALDQVQEPNIVDCEAVSIM